MARQTSVQPLPPLSDPAARPALGLVLVLALLLAVQFGLQALFFPLDEVFSSTRLNNIDAPFHTYQTQLARALCQEQRLTGYDPYFASGHLGGVSFNASSKPSAVVHCLAGQVLSAEASYKLVSFMLGVLAPALLALAAWSLNLPLMAGLGAGVLGILLWWTGAARWYHTAGMVTFVFTAFLLPLVVALYLRVQAAGSAAAVLGVGVLAAVALLIHPLFAVGATLLGLPLLWAAWGPDSRWRRWATVTLVVCALALALNAFWWFPSVTTPGFANAESPYQRVVDPFLVLREMAGLATTAGGGSRLYGAVLVAALLAVAVAPRPHRRMMIGLVLAWAVLIAWASVSAAVPRLALLQPNRFSVAAWTVLALPAAAALPWVAMAWRDTSRVWKVAVVPLVVFVLTVTGYFVRETVREVAAPAGSPRYGVQPPEVRGVGPLEDRLVQHLVAHTRRDARVLFENSLARIHDGGHIAGMVALRANRELIGGPYPYTDDISALDDWAFGAPHRQRNAAALAVLLDRYNIGWMVCHTPGCKTAMESQADIVSATEIGPLKVYARARAPGYFLQGQGQVLDSCFNRIEVQAQAGQDLVLRYHWVPGLRVEPQGRVEPQPSAPGVRAFIVVRGAPERFALKLGDAAGAPCAERQRPARP